MATVALVKADVRVVRPEHLMVLAARITAQLRIVADVVVAHHAVLCRSHEAERNRARLDVLLGHGLLFHPHFRSHSREKEQIALILENEPVLVDVFRGERLVFALEDLVGSNLHQRY